MKNCIDGYKTSKMRVTGQNVVGSIACEPGPVQKMMNKNELMQIGVIGNKNIKNDNKKVNIKSKNTNDSFSSNEKSEDRHKSQDQSNYLDTELDKKYLRESNDV